MSNSTASIQDSDEAVQPADLVQPLLHQREELEGLYREAPVGLGVVDANLRCLRINDRLAAIIGRADTECIGRSMDELNSECADACRRVIDTGQAMSDVEIADNLSVVLGGEWGEMRTWRADCYPLTSADDVVEGCSLFVRDVTETKRNSQLVAESVYFESLVADLSAGLAKLSDEELDRRIETSLSEINAVLGVERVSLSLKDDTSGKFTSRYQWLQGVAQVTEHGESVDTTFPWLAAQMNVGTVVRIHDLEEWPAEATAERADAHENGIRASIIVPFRLDETVIGFFQVSTTRASARWPQRLVGTLDILGEVLASEIARRRSEQRLSERMRFEQLIADISTSFVRLSAEKVDSEIQRAIAALGEYLDVELATVLQRDDGERAWRHTHQWVSPGFAFEALDFREVVVTDASFPWLIQKFRDMKPVSFSDPQELPAVADVERRTAEAYGICSVVWVPFVNHGFGSGFLAFNAWSRRNWTPSTIRRIGVVGDVIGSALARSRAEAKLKALNQQLAAENEYLVEASVRNGEFDNVVGRSDALKSVLYQVEQVAPTDTSVLLLGETGTGKELFARAVHAKSRRAERPLITVNCAALPSTLIEAELFGHEKGAFTGATARRIGRFALADGATIFLDEVGDLPLELQAKLLRVLQDGEFEPLGSSKTVCVDTRVIAATNRDLKAGIAADSFRTDLYYRLSVFPVELPPLRARRKDIPLLVWYFIEKHRARLAKNIKAVPAEVMDWLCRYDWPGNVREVENVIERAMILSHGEQLELNPALRPAALSADGQCGDDLASDDLASMERTHIISVLTACDWKIKGPGNAAERLGLHPNTLRYRMGKLGIERPARETKVSS